MISAYTKEETEAGNSYFFPQQISSRCRILEPKLLRLHHHASPLGL